MTRHSPVYRDLDGNPLRTTPRRYGYDSYSADYYRESACDDPDRVERQRKSRERAARDAGAADYWHDEMQDRLLTDTEPTTSAERDTRESERP